MYDEMLFGEIKYDKVVSSILLIYKGCEKMTEKKIRSESQKRADKKYSDKTINFAIKYTPTDKEEGLRLKKYLADNNISANSYIKSLVKADLDNKCIPYTNN